MPYFVRNYDPAKVWAHDKHFDAPADALAYALTLDHSGIDCAARVAVVCCVCRTIGVCE